MYYQEQIDDPASVIEQCKPLLAGWILELAEKGMLRDPDSLRKHAVTTFPEHTTVYVITLIIDGAPWFYAGQTENGQARIAKGHFSSKYRDSHSSIMYYLWNRASEIFVCLPVSNPTLVTGPILNILEQWMALVFLGLQPMDLKQNLSAETLRQIPASELNHGLNIREPLAQNLSQEDYPYKSTPLLFSKEPLKMAYSQWKRERHIRNRAEPLIRGFAYSGALTLKSRQYLVYFGGLQIPVPKRFVDSLLPDTFSIRCDLVPESQKHPYMYIGGMYSPDKWDDPARRLGIEISGFRASDARETSDWLRKEFSDSDYWIPRMNTLVDWLEGKTQDEIRPRRYYFERDTPGRGFFTRHPADFKRVEDRDAEEWKKKIPFKEFEWVLPFGLILSR
ncbi:hypothetical protein NX059_006835 [Plenodomus lindquistii]|nr:hypothetical protein NX059_006835 [Plenodomus lindquistii]